MVYIVILGRLTERHILINLSSTDYEDQNQKEHQVMFFRQIKSFAILMLMLLTATVAFGASPEKAKDELAKKEIPFTEEAFLR